MKRSRVQVVWGAIVWFAVASCLMGCGFKRQLVSITVTPNGQTVTGTGVIVNFTAQGNYIHPPDTRIITDSVVWQSSAPQVISINANTGVALTGVGCGTNITITATDYANPQTKSGTAVVGQALISVNQVPVCP